MQAINQHINTEEKQLIFIWVAHILHANYFILSSTLSILREPVATVSEEIISKTCSHLKQLKLKICLKGNKSKRKGERGNMRLLIICSPSFRLLRNDFAVNQHIELQYKEKIDNLIGTTRPHGK
jgi:hypothetical protein